MKKPEYYSTEEYVRGEQTQLYADLHVEERTAMHLKGED